MADVKNGGPAFSYTLPPGSVPVLINGMFNNAGMSKRFYAACAAMRGDWAGPDPFPNDAGSEVLRNRAQLYLRMADALIEEEGK